MAARRQALAGDRCNARRLRRESGVVHRGQIVEDEECYEEFDGAPTMMPCSCVAPRVGGAEREHGEQAFAARKSAKQAQRLDRRLARGEIGQIALSAYSISAPCCVMKPLGGSSRLVSSLCCRVFVAARCVAVQGTLTRKLLPVVLVKPTRLRASCPDSSAPRLEFAARAAADALPLASDFSPAESP